MSEAKYTKLVAAKVTRDEYRQIQEAARLRKDSTANMIRSAIRKHILDNNQAIS